jgi:Protein of unknown function (DUF3631)
MVTIFRRLFPGSPEIFEPEITHNRESKSSAETMPIGDARATEPTGRQVVPAQHQARVEQGDRLLDEIAAGLRRHVVMPDGAAEMITLWVMHGHAHDAAQYSPILALESPDTGCGKTTLLRVLAPLSPMPLFSSNISTAGFYRTIAWRIYTLLVDEADAFLRGNNELRGILNSGHCRQTAQVVRADGVFSTWCPKAVALIGELPATLRDRSLRVGLKRMRREEKVAPLDSEAVARLKQLGAQAAVWAKQHHDQLARANPAMPQMITNRAADNWLPLLAIADAVGGHWPKLARAHGFGRNPRRHFPRRGLIERYQADLQRVRNRPDPDGRIDQGIDLDGGALVVGMVKRAADYGESISADSEAVWDWSADLTIRNRTCERLLTARF